MKRGEFIINDNVYKWEFFVSERQIYEFNVWKDLGNYIAHSMFRVDLPPFFDGTDEQLEILAKDRIKSELGNS